MDHLEKLRNFYGILKDKASLIKAKLSNKRPNSTIRRAIIRATTHGSSSPPSDHRIDVVLSFGNGSLTMACTCIQALMDRLNGTRNAIVALKSLYTIHNIITKGSLILKGQLSTYPSFGGRNYLNLSNFQDDSDPESSELSTWIRWYASVLEKNLMVSRVLGYYLSSSNSNKKNQKDKAEKIFSLMNSDLLREMEALIGFVQEISNVPKSLNLQRNDLVYEIVRLVSEDYRAAQREVFLRVDELGERMASLNFDELTLFLNSLKKFEDCKEKLVLLFVNRMKNDGLWDLIGETKMEIEKMMNKKEKKKAKMNKKTGRAASSDWGQVRTY